MLVITFVEGDIKSGKVQPDIQAIDLVNIESVHSGKSLLDAQLSPTKSSKRSLLRGEVKLTRGEKTISSPRRSKRVSENVAKKGASLTEHITHPNKANEALQQQAVSNEDATNKELPGE